MRLDRNALLALSVLATSGCLPAADEPSIVAGSDGLGVVAGTVLWDVEGLAALDRLGSSVAALGDVNGDGWSDFAVSAPDRTETVGGEGLVLVFHGGPFGPDPVADWSQPGGQVDAGLGHAVAGAGDLNGDGYSDLAVGAPLWDEGTPDVGKVTVYLGSSSGLETSPARELFGVAGAGFGSALAGVGDVNGDGYGDLLVGAPDFTDLHTGEGRVGLHLGTVAGLAEVPTWTADGGEPGAGLGTSVAAAFDVDADGRPDLLAGAPGAAGGGTQRGEARFWFGTVGALATAPDWTGQGTDDGGGFGASVAGVGSVNGDVYGEILVGAPTQDGTHLEGGAAHLFVGTPGGPLGSPTWSVEGPRADAHLGAAVAAAGDPNGDGYADVLVGAPDDRFAPVGEGVARLFLGDPVGLLQTDAIWDTAGGHVNAALGSCLAGVGDVDGDGFDDLLLGVPQFNGGGVASGKVALFAGQGDPPAHVLGWAQVGASAGQGFGYRLGSVVDVHGDGLAELVVKSGPEDAAGVIQIYEAGPGGLGTTHSDVLSGWVVGFGASGGDFDGDGYGDLVVGGEDEFWVLPGGLDGLDGPDASPSASFTFDLGDLFGYANSDHVNAVALGDVDGDGYDDLAAAYLSTLNGCGDCIVGFYGGAGGPSAPPDWEPSYLADVRFGWSMAGAGDVNGDGFADVIVGTPFSGADAGEARLYLGSATGLPSTDAWVFSGSAGDRVGVSVDGAGDVNGDGFDDIVVGADGSGQALVFLGRDFLAPLTTPAWTGTISGGAAGDYGYAVSGAGDVNGDGYADLLVGAPRWANTTGGTGSSFLYLGSASGPSLTADWENGSSTDPEVGVSVHGGFDVNGDGLSDVAVGSWTYDGSGAASGLAQLFHGNGLSNEGEAVTRPVVVRTVGGAPIAPGLRSDLQTFVLVAATPESWRGRARVALQAEVKPRGTAFDGTDLQTGPWQDSTAGQPLELTVLGLGPDAAYSWRARYRLDPLGGGPLTASPWFVGVPGSPGRVHVRTTAEAEVDGDGWPPSTDCDDNDPSVNPGAAEACASGVDEDCDGLVDGLDPDCSGDDDDSAGDDDDSAADDDDVADDDDSGPDDDDVVPDDDDSAPDDDDVAPDDDDSAPDDDDSGPDDDDSGPDDDDGTDDDDGSSRYEGDEPGECSDGADNDGDGHFDCDDQDCSGSPACPMPPAPGCDLGCSSADGGGGGWLLLVPLVLARRRRSRRLVRVVAPGRLGPADVAGARQ
jgi:hypothetical protein